ncbi:hypothetical protein PMAYCL1PPCAC_10078, partial [Pristionchus mayeri]
LTLHSLPLLSLLLLSIHFSLLHSLAPLVFLPLGRRMRPDLFPDTTSTSECFSSCSEASIFLLDDDTPLRASRTSSDGACVVVSNSSYAIYDDSRNDNVHAIAASLSDETDQIDIRKYFLGLKTAEEAAACTTPTALRLYYQVPIDGCLASTLPLFLVYQSNKNQIFHFPIVEEAGRWRIKYGESDQVTYPSVHSLLLQKINYAIVSPFDAGELESFEVWKAARGVKK